MIKQNVSVGRLGDLERQLRELREEVVECRHRVALLERELCEALDREARRADLGRGGAR
jgi:hypothetical protein